LVVLRTVQVAQRLKRRVDVRQLLRLHDPSGDGIEEEEGAQPTLGEKAADVIGYSGSIDSGQRVVIALDPRYADRVVPQEMNQAAHKLRA
jgi:hypothetical protein